jgi:hypothetical protein
MTFTEFIEGLEKRHGMGMGEVTFEAVTAYTARFPSLLFRSRTR